ncbi:MAG: hypothetical protein FJW20_24235 [Acidimicrobiia bacterium]|nr:hypothetical protein [Acidimicrobiia bacterium]
MAPINMARVILGGLVAGLIINISEFVLNVIVLEAQWREAMTSLNRQPVESVGTIVAFNIIGFIYGIFTVWLYAAIRPRYGPGVKTALCAGSSVWLIGYAMALAFPVLADLFPIKLIAISLLWGLVELLVASVVGAKLYQEAAGPQAAAAASGG